ncbi:hypothetical protein [Sphingobium sp. HDIP04]|uniref:hypothetical protein n=1 Tax=Sphingobium sp. HDIP04 TaxID=428994 RepID=UPI0003875FE3|nr:hypothetical protein [Sphingobium sp. HDIP04]EQA97275.1 hypothetical protein L286_23405 [Sphingobium sp. HDIP04]
MPIRPSLRPPSLNHFRDFQRGGIQRLENAALVASDRGARMVVSTLRAEMAAAGLGRLGNAITSTSDLRRSGRVHRRGAEGFSASGIVHLRTENERTVGAIISYTEGAEITPRGPWLWIASDDLQKRVKGNFRMTPARYRAGGYESKIGPLVQIPGRHPGEALLIVRNVTTRMAGRANPRRLPASGRVRAGRALQEQFVAFIGIRRTSRRARVNPRAILAWARSNLPFLIRQALGK